MKNMILATALLASTSILAMPIQTQKHLNDKREQMRYVQAELNRKSDIPNYIGNAKNVLAKKFGVSESSLANFWQGISSVQPSTPQDCLNLLDDNDTQRSLFLDCLADQGKNILNETLYKDINHYKLKKLQFTNSPEGQKTITLLFIIEELIKFERNLKGKNSNWYSVENGFLDISDKADFPYENGDILLEVGSSSISALITQSTFPERKFSHAFVLKIDDKAFQTFEALIETGVTSRSKKELFKNEFQTVLVLRLKDKDKRATVSQVATQCAEEHYNKNTPYDFAFDSSNEDRMFCSELVSTCFAKGIYEANNGQVSFEDVRDNFISQQATVKSDALFKFLNNFGVTQETMPSPGDLLSSPYLEVVAEFRKTDSNQSKLWNVISWGDIFVNKIDQGTEFNFSWFSKYLAKPILNAVNWTLDTVTGNEMMFLPTGIDATVAGYMSVMELMTYKPVVKNALAAMKRDGIDTDDLLNTPIWVRYAYLHYYFEKNKMIRYISR